MSNRQQLLNRIADAGMRAAAAKAFEIADRAAARRAAIFSDARMSDIGRASAIAAEFEKDFAPSFRLSRQPIRDARVALSARKAKVSALPAATAADAVVNQLAAMEIRSHIVSLDVAARTRLIFDPATDRRIIDAVLAAAPELSGIPRDRHAALLQQRLQELYPDEIAAIEEDERSLAEAEAAVAVAQNDLRTAAGDGRKFDALVNRAAIPWLVDQGNGHIATVKIDANGMASYPPATDREKRTGKFFKDIAEYRAQAA